MFHNNKTSKNQKVICVLGMHRSGTSLVTGLLRMVGIYLGSDDEMYPPGKGNPKGHWENMTSKKINEDLLREFGGAGDNPPYFPPNWFRQKGVVSEIRRRGVNFINKMNEKSKIWAWKDPRTSLTLEFWKDLLPNVYYIIPLRDPMAVAKSLEARDSMPVNEGLKLCALYWVSILFYTRGENRLFVRYDDVIKNWEKEYRRISKYISYKGVSVNMNHQMIEQFIDPMMNHHRLVHSNLDHIDVTKTPTVERYMLTECQSIIGCLGKKKEFEKAA